MFTRILAPLALLVAILTVGCSREAPEPIADAPPPDANRGQQLFTAACAQCHGLTAQGVKGLGANLHTSPFVLASSDTQLLEMIKAGRKPTMGRPAMPPKGGRFDYTDQDLLDIIAWIRTLAKPQG
jgi:mono/diheme cytochrome c family protein